MTSPHERLADLGKRKEEIMHLPAPTAEDMEELAHLVTEQVAREETLAWVREKIGKEVEWHGMKACKADCLCLLELERFVREQLQ